MKIKDILEVFKERQAIRKRISGLVAEEMLKRKQYQALVGQELNYPIIQDLINSAARGVEVVITFRDATVMKMTRQAGMSPEDMKKAWGELF
jgi:hypothetical protein